jgi:hypothetical protein
MRRQDRPLSAGFHDTGENPCEFHDSDSWLLVDALLAILAGVATILLVLVRHPFRLVGFAILLAVVGTVAGWWVP